MAELLSKPEFREALEDAITGREAKNASFSQAWANGELEREHFARWAENHYHYVGPFADYLGYIYSNTPDYATDAKDFLLQNMYEEELSDVRHTDLLIRFAEAAGTTRERVMDIDNATAVTRGLQGWCYAIAMREHFAVATAALVVGLESQVPSIYRRQYPVLLEKYGFTEEEAEFFDLHITSDEIHGERGYQIVLEHADHARVASTLPATGTPWRRGALLVHEGALRHLRRAGTTAAPGDAGRSRTRLTTAVAAADAHHPTFRQPAAKSPSQKATRSTCYASRIRNDCGIPFKCASGNCGTDRVRVESGLENCMPMRRRERERLAELVDQGYRFACQTYVNGDVTIAWDPEQIGLDEGSRVYDKLKQVWLAKDDGE